MDSDFNSWVLERRIQQLGETFSWNGFTMNPKVNLKMVQANLDKPWHWALFKNNINSDIPLEFYLEQGQKESINKSFWLTHKNGFNLSHLGIKYNTKIKIEHMLQYERTPGDWYNFSSNPNFQFQYVLDYPNLLDYWDWDAISEHQNVTLDMIVEHIDFPWKWKIISENKNIYFEHIQHYPNLPWDWKKLSKHPNILIEDILKTEDDFPWDWDGVSMNPNLKLKHVLAIPQYPWCWISLVKHPNITFKDILKNDHLPWGSKGNFAVRFGINFNPNLTLEDIKKNPLIEYRKQDCKISYIYWQQYTMVYNKNFNINWILHFPKILQLNSLETSKNIGITWDDVQKHKHFNWNYVGLSGNPNVSIKNILSRRDIYWDWFIICARPDFLDPLDEQETREYFASKKICRTIFECFTNPEYEMCRRRLQKEFKDYYKII